MPHFEISYSINTDLPMRVFGVDERVVHTRLARQSIRLITKALKKDICGLKDPSVLMKDSARI